jgi:hypothetical protein
MNIYKLSQITRPGYDVYDSCVVYAETPQEARSISPERSNPHQTFDNAWVPECDVIVELIGVAVQSHPKGIICASFNGG